MISKYCLLEMLHGPLEVSGMLSRLRPSRIGVRMGHRGWSAQWERNVYMEPGIPSKLYIQHRHRVSNFHVKY